MPGSNSAVIISRVRGGDERRVAEVSEARPDNNEGPRPGSEAARLSRRRSPGPGHTRRPETRGSWQVSPAGVSTGGVLLIFQMRIIMDMSVYPPPLYRLFPFIDVTNIIGVRYVSIIHLFEICRSHRNSCTLNFIFGEAKLRHFKRQ